MNNLQTEINEKVNTNHNKGKKEIDIARKAFPCFIFIFVGVVSVFSYHIYIVQPQQINSVQEIFEQKVNVLQSQIQQEVERKVNVLQKQIQQEVERKVNVLQKQIEQEVERKVNVLQSQIQQEVERKVNVLQSQIQQEVEREVHVLQSQFKEEVKKVWKNCESKIAVIESQLETKLDEVQRTLPYGSNTFTWKITGFGYISLQAKEGNQTRIRTDPFCIFGYKLKLHMIPNGNGHGAGSHISVFIVVMKGENDAILSWPFYERVTFTLIDQQENPNSRENIVMSFKANPENKYCFGRPVKDVNSGHGFTKFVSHDKLRERRYIVDDTIFIQVELAKLLY